MNLLDTARSLVNYLSQRQHKRLLKLTFPNGDGPSTLLAANSLNADEGLSRDFRYVVEVLAEDANIPLKDVQGKLVTIELERDDGSPRYFNGYVFEFRFVRADGGFAFYEMLLLPWLAFLRLRRDNYLFHNKTLLDCTKETFADYELRDYELRIKGEDPTFTDCCQFDETDYNHLHRRWEAQGWYYWYEHRVDGHTLVLSDDPTAAAPVDGTPTIAFQRDSGPVGDDGIGDWAPVRAIMPAKVALSSFDFKNPRPLLTEVDTVNRQGSVPALEVYEYAGAYGFQTQSHGDALAKQRMEEIEAQGKHFEGIGDARSVQPGRWFRLSGHFDGDLFNSASGDNEFLVIDASHYASNNYLMAEGEPPVYTNRLTCIRKHIPWRPGRSFNSIEPKIFGLQTATVVGPSGEEIWCDEYGRVRVQFHWDREGAFDEKSSAWVRVATMWAGPNFGSVSIPRIGSEVIVQFLDGNPDRPLITGMVPNQSNMPPWDLPANKTQSGILTRSTVGGGYENANAIRFEDKKGAEELWLHAEKDQRIEVENDESHWVGHDRIKTVDHDETVHVKHDRTETVDNNETITVHNNRTERVDHNETISIGDNRTEDVGANETVSIGGSRSVTIGGSKTETITKAKAETIGLAKALTIGAGYQTTVGGAMNTSVGLAQTEQVGLSKSTSVGKKYSIDAGDELSITVGESSFVMKSNGTILIKGSKISIQASGPIDINGKDVDIN